MGRRAITMWVKKQKGEVNFSKEEADEDGEYDTSTNVGYTDMIHSIYYCIYCSGPSLITPIVRNEGEDFQLPIKSYESFGIAAY
jgi:hypothetical protein